MAVKKKKVVKKKTAKKKSHGGGLAKYHRHINSCRVVKSTVKKIKDLEKKLVLEKKKKEKAVKARAKKYKTL